MATSPFRFDDSEHRELMNKLGNFASRGLPHAIKFGLNKSAFEARTAYVSRAQEELTLRNAWTRKSIRFSKAGGRSIAGMESVVGSTQEYMRVQEEGGVEQKKGTHGVPIPTSVASGEGRGARPRKKTVRRPSRMRNIQLGDADVGSMSRKQRNAVTIAIARRQGKRHVFLELDGNVTGIFKLKGGKRSPKIDLIWSLQEPIVRTPALNLLEKTMDGMEPRLPEFHKDALIEQLRRHGVIRRF